MPRRPKQEVVHPTTSMVASAVNYKGTAARIYNGAKDWQQECYRHYGICGEARFAAQFYGHAMSRALLTTVKKGPDGPQIQTSGSGYDTLQALFHGKNGQAQMLHSAGVHLTIAGEFYLIGRQVPVTDVDEVGEEYDTGETEEVWEVISVTEVKAAGRKWQITGAENTKTIDLTDDDVVIRVWDPDPANRMNADSPFKALLPLLAEIEWLTRSIFAQASSRLAGAGLLLLPQDMTFPKPPAVDGVEVESDTDAFMRVLADAMLTPIEDPSSPSAMVPITIQAPGDAIDKARLMHFWSELDAAVGPMRQDAIRRFAGGMDLPPEQMLGMSSGGTGGGASTGVSHWGAWQIEEATIKMHIEPKLELVANALSIGYLRPLNGPDEYVGYDSSALRLRPDRSREALELYNLGLLSAEVTLRENGFDVEDMPSTEEFKKWLLRRVASGSATPDQVQAALEALGVVLNIPTPLPIPAPEMPNEARPAPSLEEHPTRDLPNPEAAVLAASEALVFRALERSGNRIRQSMGIKPSGVKAFDMHTLHHVNGEAGKCLEDAWSCAPQVLEGIAPVEQTVATLDAYVRSLFATQQPHSRDSLRRWLEASR